MDFDEIGEKLGVSARTARRYVREPPGEEVRETLETQATQVRLAAFNELKRQLREAGQRSRTAETPMQVYERDDGTLEVRDIRDDDGNLVAKKPVPQGLELLPDEQARYYAREEARDILEMLIDLVGAGEPDELEVSGEVEHEADEWMQKMTEMGEDLAV